MHGSINVTKKRFAEIIAITKNASDVSEVLGGDELEQEEKLLLINKGKAEQDYWAFQPYDAAPLNEYVFSSDKNQIGKAFIQQCMDCYEVEAWDSVDEDLLINWAERIASDNAEP